VKSWSVIFATIVIFGAGVITGGLLVNYVKHPMAMHRPNGPGIKPPLPSTNELAEVPPQMRAQILNKQFVGQLSEELDLTPDQRQQIQKIISQGQQNTRDLWKLVAPQFQVIWRDTRVQIRGVLTPDQRKEFETLMRQQRHMQSTNVPPAQLSSPTNPPPIQATPPPVETVTNSSTI
jgi:hypothetical protein